MPSVVVGLLGHDQRFEAIPWGEGRLFFPRGEWNLLWREISIMRPSIAVG